MMLCVVCVYMLCVVCVYVCILLFQVKSPWNERAIHSAHMRARTDLASVLEKARVRALAGESNGFVAELPTDADGANRSVEKNDEYMCM